MTAVIAGWGQGHQQLVATATTAEGMVTSLKRGGARGRGGAFSHMFSHAPYPCSSAAGVTKTYVALICMAMITLPWCRLFASLCNL